jgi:hypothetical protein
MTDIRDGTALKRRTYREIENEFRRLPSQPLLYGITFCLDHTNRMSFVDVVAYEDAKDHSLEPGRKSLAGKDMDMLGHANARNSVVIKCDAIKANLRFRLQVLLQLRLDHCDGMLDTRTSSENEPYNSDSRGFALR